MLSGDGEEIESPVQTLNLLPLKCFLVVNRSVAHDVQCWGRILHG